jgi:F420-dependent oxidoreductase-like protein
MMAHMQLRIFVEPQQGASYETLRRAARAAEDAGFEAFFRSDHYLAFGGGDGLPGPTDAWTTLAGLARDTTRIRLGTLVTSATFRLPGPLAIAVAQVDEMSGGRVELGLGAGWFDAEHAAYAIPFPTLAERFDRLEEQLDAIVALWTTPTGETFTRTGRHYRFTDSPALPKPVQHPHPPVIVGGGGPRRTPRLAATYAQEYNAPFLSPDETRAAFARVDDACRAIGRDPATLRRSFAVTTCCGRTESAVEGRASAAGFAAADLRRIGACGTPDELAERLAAWGDAGAETAYLQLPDPADLDHIELLGGAVAPLLATR